MVGGRTRRRRWARTVEPAGGIEEEPGTAGAERTALPAQGTPSAEGSGE